MRIQQFNIYTKDTTTGAVVFTTNMAYPEGTKLSDIKKAAARKLNRSVDATFVEPTNVISELV